MTTGNRNLDAALALARAGIKIFPVGTDKRPLFRDWQSIATTDIDVIADWWRRAPHALPAVACGANGLLVLDLDRHSNDADGVRAFKQLVETHGGLPPCPMVHTPNGGLHLYFRQPEGKPLTNSRGSLPAGIDVRGIGGFVVGVGAALPDGRGWASARNRPPVTKDTIPPLPAWPLKLLRGNGAERNAERDAERSTVATVPTDDERGRAYALAALEEIETELTFTAPGDRNGKLFKASFRLATMMARGWLAENEIVDALVGASELNGYLREHGQAATRRTIASGLRGGERVPHEDLTDRHYASDYEPEEPEEPQEEPQEKPQEAGHEEQGKDQEPRPEKPQESQEPQPPPRQPRPQQQQQRRQQQQPITGDWDDPDISILDDRRGELPEMSITAFPPILHRWIHDAARGAGVTCDHVAVPLIGISSGLVGVARRVQFRRAWLAVMTCWAALIGLSGSGKTPTMKIFRRALDLIEGNRRTEITALRLAHETRAETAKAATKKWKEEVAAAVKAGQRPPQKPAEAMDVEPFVTPRIYVSDTTVERLGPLLQARPRGLLYIADELARLFLNMERYSGGSDRPFWLEAWDAGSYVIERQGRPSIAVAHLLVGVVGGFQPSKLTKCFEDDADGMYNRFLYGWPPEPAYAPSTDDVDEIDPELVNALGRLIALPAEENGVFAPRNVKLADDAVTAFEHFRQLQDRGKAGLDGREREYWCKGTAHVLRLAGTLCFLDWAWKGGPEPQTIGGQYVESAVALWCEYFWPHGCAALRQVGLDEKHINARRVLRWIKDNDKQEVSREELRREALGKRLDAEGTQAVIDGLVRAGWLRLVTTATPGRPIRRWQVNPKLFRLYRAERSERVEREPGED